MRVAKFLFNSGLIAGALGSCWQSPSLAAEAPYVYRTTWGALSRGLAIAIGDSGNAYLVSFDQVLKYDHAGNFITAWGSAGSGDGQFLSPTGVALDPSENVYVADTSNNRIQKFDRNGVFLTKWGTEGTGEGQFTSPQSVAADRNGNVYVADGHGGIQKFDTNGGFLLSWAAQGDLATGPEGHVYVAGDPIKVYDAGGDFLFSFGVAAAIATDGNGNVYAMGNLFSKYNASGELLTSAAASDQAGCGQPGWFAVLQDIGADSSGLVYLLDYYCELVQVFGPADVGVASISWGSAKSLWR